MELSQIAGIFAAILLFIYALFKIPTRFSSVKKRDPPEAGGGWPLIGHLHLLSGKDQPTHKTLAKMADVYGPIFTIRLGMKKTVVVSNWEIAKECFTTNDKFLASRPKMVASKLLGYDDAMVKFSPHGPYWRHMRRITTAELLSNHRMEILQPIRKLEVETSIKKLYEICVNNGGDRKALVDMNRWFEDINLNITFKFVVGKGFFAAMDGYGDSEEFRQAWKDFFIWFGVFVPSDAFSFLSFFDLGGHEKGMKKTAKVLDQVFDKWLEEHRQRIRSSSQLGVIDPQPQDLIDVMLSLVKDSVEFPNYDEETIIKATCLTIILAGPESSTATMSWALSLLLNNPEALKKVQLELDEQVGRHRQVNESDIKNLVYFQAIIKETLRINHPGPLAIPRESTEDCTIAGYHIPAGTRLMVNIQKLQKDPLVWEDPCEFRPERFLTTQKDFDFRGKNAQYIPFGNGRRMCPGIQFSVQSLHLTLANLLHGFEIDRPSNELINMDESMGLSSMKKNPLEVVLSPRLSAKAYE